MSDLYTPFVGLFLVGAALFAGDKIDRYKSTDAEMRAYRREVLRDKRAGKI